MRDQQASSTAAFVAACRGLGVMLPVDARIAEDPFGVRFGSLAAQGLRAVAERLGPASPILEIPLAPLVPWVAYMQVRTRFFDDTILDFVRAGGRQVVILGAGFDCRAVRFASELSGTRIFEVDFPATQERKRRVLDQAGAVSPARYLSWNFERDPVSDLGQRLAELGHDPTAPTVTLWEGVTMYLTEEAISATTLAVGAWSAPGSLFTFNYMHKGEIEDPGVIGRALSLVVRGLGEPFRTGFHPDSLPGWLQQRGFGLKSDDEVEVLARERLPAHHAWIIRGGRRRFAVAERFAVAKR